MAGDLHAAGVRRINVSLDTLDPAAFAAVTRWGKLEQVLDGIFAAKAAGLAIRINAVALKGVNEHEYDRMVAWCGEHGFDLCLIETMPLGDISGDRTDQYIPLSLVRDRIRAVWTLDETDYRTGGPARYYTVRETGRRVGFITPMTHNFCEILQPRPPHLHRHPLHVPRPGGCGGPPQGPARPGRHRGRPPGRDPRRHRPQAEGPRFRHRPPPGPPGGRAAHERHRRLELRPRRVSALGSVRKDG